MSHARYYVPSAAELRAIWAGYRIDHEAAGTAGAAEPAEPAEPDGDLETMLEEPFADEADVSDRLGEVEAHLRAAGDRRSVFLTVYAEMTDSVVRAIDSGFFADPAWVGAYLVGFADDYREALLAFERGNLGRVPRPWQLAFDASTGGGTHVLQDALLGINAHINYDLPYTLHDVGIDPERADKRADHDRINRILRRLVDTVQEALVDIYAAADVADVDTAFGRTDEQLATLGLRGSRDLAWRNAVLLTDARWPPVRRYVDWRVRTVATGGASVILGGGLGGRFGGGGFRDGVPDADTTQPTVEEFRQAFDRNVPMAEPSTW